MPKYLSLIIVLIVLVCSCHPSGKSRVTVPTNEQQPVTEVTKAPVVVTEPERPLTNFQRPETWLMGYFQHDLLVRPPHNEWFVPQYNNYEPSEELVFKIMETNMAEVSVLIVLGTWCPDTRREVPRFFKLADQCGMTRMKITLLGADMNKFAPIGDYDKLGILKVPTFIVYRNNIEAGRIIEHPQTSLEGDLAEILLKK
jgi:hypothetical protein